MSPSRPRKPVTERLGMRNAASDSVSSKQPAVISLKSIKSDTPAVEVVSLEEIYRQRALESMLRARGQAAVPTPKPEPPVELEEPQVDCRRVVVNSQEPEEPRSPPRPINPQRARVSVRERLGARISPKKEARTKRRKTMPVAVVEDVISDDNEPVIVPVRMRRRGAPAAAEWEDESEEEEPVALSSELEYDSEDEEPVIVKKRKPAAPVAVKTRKPAALLTAKKKKPTTPVIVKKRKPGPAMEPEHNREDEEPVRVPLKKRKSVTPVAVKKRTSVTPVVIKKRKPVPAMDPEYENEEEEPVTVSLKKKKPAPAMEPEYDSEDEEPVTVSLKKRKPVVAVEPEYDSEDSQESVDAEENSDDEEPVIVARKPDRLKPVKVTIIQDPRPMKKKLSDRIGSASAEQKQLKKKVMVSEAVEDELQTRDYKLIRSADNATISVAKVKPLQKVKALEKPTDESAAASKRVKKSMSEFAVASRHLKKAVEEASGVEGKPLKKMVVVNDALAERKRLKKLMADHVLKSAVDKPRRKITLVTDVEEDINSKMDTVGKSPEVLSLEEIRRRKQLKMATVKKEETSESASDSEKGKSASRVLSLKEIRQRNQQKEVRPQPVYDISLFTDRGGEQTTDSGGQKNKDTIREEPCILSLEEIRRRKLKRQQGQSEDAPPDVQGSLSIRPGSRKTAPAPARRSKAEQQIYVPPARKNTVVSVSPSKETVAVKKRLGETVTARAQTEEKQEGGAIGVKTFSEIMAEKRRKRQLEREQQQKKKQSDQQENNNGAGTASRKTFRFQPIMFGGEEDSLSNSPKHTAPAAVVNMDNSGTRLTAEADIFQGKSSQSTFAGRLGASGDDSVTLKKHSGGAVARKNLSKETVYLKVSVSASPKAAKVSSASGQLLMTESLRLASEPSRVNYVVNPLPHSSSTSAITPCTRSDMMVCSVLISANPAVSQPQATTPQHSAVTTAAVRPSSPQPQPLHVSTASTIAPSLTTSMTPPSVRRQSISSGKSPAAESKTASSHQSTSRLLSESQDELLLSEADAVTLDDTDQLDDLLMDIDSLLE